MTSDTFTLLAKYNRGVNEKMEPLLRGLNDDEWNRDLGGFFPSIRSLCSHLYICDFVWLKRFGGMRAFRTLGADLFKENHGFQDSLFPDRAGYFEKRPELDEKIIGFIGEITGEDLPKIVKYTDSEKALHERPLEGALLHVFSHQIHHRGMISLYLELLGKQNDFSALMPVIYGN
ncbi:MAG: DinB family protein [Spirochaetaceae bacterium]|jgi:uncharacterized damage-inducible protein DinB|nr:DinB family protein [Spirochaetaceae bacterium]